MRKSVTGVVARPLRLGAMVSVASACAALFMLPAAQAQPVKSYDSTKKDFWEHPPADWFLGDETQSQKGLAPPSGPALPASI